MKKQLLTLTIAALLTIGQSAMAFEQINSENNYETLLSNGWVDQASENYQAIKVSYRQSTAEEVSLNGSSENDMSAINFTFPSRDEATGSSDPLSANYSSNR